MQPKAAGSSILYKLTNSLVTHAFKIAGWKTPVDCIVLPLATGMTLCLAFTALRNKIVNSSGDVQRSKNKVIWSRIDQKSCFKAILLAGLVPIIVEPLLEATGMITNVEEIERLLIEDSLKEFPEILCVASTTSCFAPRQPDRIDAIAVLCEKYKVAHIVNNAYGMQCSVIGKLIDRAFLKGRVDAVVQSSDKNFMVPVGGAILACAKNNAWLLKEVCGSYPGRASSSPIGLLTTYLLASFVHLLDYVYGFL